MCNSDFLLSDLGPLVTVTDAVELELPALGWQGFDFWSIEGTPSRLSENADGIVGARLLQITLASF